MRRYVRVLRSLARSLIRAFLYVTRKRHACQDANYERGLRSALLLAGRVCA